MHFISYLRDYSLFSFSKKEAYLSFEFAIVFDYFKSLGHLQLQELSEEDEYQSGYSDEEVDAQEEDEGDYDDAERSHRSHRHRPHKKRSYANEDHEGEGEYRDEDESGSNDEIG